MSDRMAFRLLVAVAVALVEVGIVAALSLHFRTAHVWPGCLCAAGTGLWTGYAFSGLLRTPGSRP
jgi:hypothetical protein